MGLSISPGVFQLYTNRHTRDFKQQAAVQLLLERGSVIEVMMDDFLLGSPNLEDHLKLLELWFIYGRKNKLYFKLTKCEFGMKELIVLGRRVGYQEWGPIKDKVESLCIKKPTNKAELRSLLGSVNWIRRHIVNVEPTYVLSNLLRKNIAWRWSAEHEAAWIRFIRSTEASNGGGSPYWFGAYCGCFGRLGFGWRRIYFTSHKIFPERRN
jgi:hypothetical protein